MKTVVSDTSPIRYIVAIGEADLLPRLFSTLVIPYAVFQELSHPHTLEIVRQLVTSTPSWIDVRHVENTHRHAALAHLDAGERETIILAEQMHADLLLIDEKKGRYAAIERRLPVIGTLGVLELASQRTPLDLADLFDKLLQTNFKVSPSLLAAILKRHENKRLL
jgi:predicted nucleic acid-binding protein